MHVIVGIIRFSGRNTISTTNAKSVVRISSSEWWLGSDWLRFSRLRLVGLKPIHCYFKGRPSLSSSFSFVALRSQDQLTMASDEDSVTREPENPAALPPQRSHGEKDTSA